MYATRGLGYYKDSLKRYPKSEEFGAALTKVWEWHWEYWVATGDIVNLMDFYSRGVENDSPETVINTDDTDTDKNIDNDVADDTQKTDTYDLAESEDETAETENGFITFLINHIFTIIVVIAAAVGFAYIYIFKIRRQKNG